MGSLNQDVPQLVRFAILWSHFVRNVYSNLGAVCLPFNASKLQTDHLTLTPKVSVAGITIVKILAHLLDFRIFQKRIALSPPVFDGSTWVRFSCSCNFARNFCQCCHSISPKFCLCVFA